MLIFKNKTTSSLIENKTIKLKLMNKTIKFSLMENKTIKLKLMNKINNLSMNLKIYTQEHPEFFVVLEFMNSNGGLI